MESEVSVPPSSHYRAPGDEEEYKSPMRASGKSRGSSTKGKRKSAAREGERERKRVKWDRALVFEGPITPHAETEGIIKVRLRCECRPS